MGKAATNKSNQLSSFLHPDRPGVPVGPVRIEENDGMSVMISWEPPEKDGGANVSGYVVEQRDAHRPGWITISESVTRPCFKFTRLNEGTEYVFRAAAMNRFGVGSFLQSEVVECKSAKSESSELLSFLSSKYSFIDLPSSSVNRIHLCPSVFPA